MASSDFIYQLVVMDDELGELKNFFVHVLFASNNKMRPSLKKCLWCLFNLCFQI